MKILITTSRVLLGLILKVFGLNGFLHFVPTAVANPLIGPLFASHYPRVVFAVAAIRSTFLLVNRYMPVALTLLSCHREHRAASSLQHSDRSADRIARRAAVAGRVNQRALGLAGICHQRAQANLCIPLRQQHLAGRKLTRKDNYNEH
jgi:hypothetical protein